MVPGASPVAAAGRGLVGLFAVPLLAVAMARNRDWHVDIHVSRTLVLHTAALVASGVFCMSLAAAGLFVRELGGAWGPEFELLTLVGSAIVLVAVMGSRDLRVHLKRFVARHFFSHRFDYRTEWLRFVETVSQPGTRGDTLQVRVIRALAQIVDSPAGSLWCSQDGRAFVPEAAWNLPVERGLKLPAGHAFLAGFRDGSWIQERPAAAAAAVWPFDPTDAWVAIPLAHGDALIAFVILAPPPNGYRLDWETFDLLRAAGRQAASYLAEERSMRALGDSRALNDFSKRFAFVVHDFKNLASQLGMVVANARRHMDNPEFRSDMLETLESSVARMNRLIEQMRAGGRQTPPQIIEPDVVIADLAQELYALGIPIQTRLDACDCKVGIDRDQFRSILSHLINNAREAAQSSDVVVASHRAGHQIVIDVVDTGPGMEDEFIREEFLRPFRSTKPGGMGIGGYQIREMLRLAGGELEVISEKGVGTVMRCTFPMHDETELVQSAA
jgi:putative PEP-CTERM system histidine kinase